MPQTALRITKPPGRRNRAAGTGSIHLHKNSVSITWYLQGKRYYENLGSVSVEQATKILDQRTKRIREKLQQARELARQFLRSESTTVATSAPPARTGRPKYERPRWVFTDKEHDILHAIAIEHPRDMIGFCRDLDKRGFSRLVAPDYPSCEASYRAKDPRYCPKLRVLKSRATTNKWH